MALTDAGGIVFVPLAPEHVPDAAALVAARIRMLRSAAPAVPPAWEDEAAIARLILGLALRGSAVVALRDGTPIGFQAATFIDGHGGRWAYTSDVGHAAAGVGRARLIGALYSHLADTWVRDGCVEHVVTVLADDAEAIDAFGRLGFGRTVVDLVRDLSPVIGATLGPGSAVAIRRAAPSDAVAIHGLDQGLRRHLAASPVFLRPAPARSPEIQRHELGEARSATFLAEADGRAVAYLRLGPSATDVATIVRDPRTASITAAFTIPERRGDGVATALLAAARDWARNSGYIRLAVDHESANGEAERFWVRHCVPVAYSMTRRLAPRGGG